MTKKSAFCGDYPTPLKGSKIAVRAGAEEERSGRRRLQPSASVAILTS